MHSNHVIASLFVSAISALALSACSSSSSSSNEGGAQEASRAVASSICDRYQACAPVFGQVVYGELEECKSRFELLVRPVFDAPGTSATPAQIQRCASDVANVSCDDLLGRRLPESCQVKPGALEDGAPCGVDWQCAGRYCRKGDGACGACSRVGAAGASCDADEGCEAGLKCHGGACMPYGEAGASCDDDRLCHPSLVCRNGTCATPAAAGEACEPPGLGACDVVQGLYCSEGKTCTAVRVAGPGEVCGVVDGALVACRGGSSCDTDDSGRGNCGALADDGAPCDDDDGPSCRLGARCVDGVCTLENPAACR